ncbi:MAG: uroporphyrinogen-III C-methyltransferase [Synergistaceae bacterium]|nr:uroporphyrinogen-III C-methyltransferase [Synergistaceae bacterium]
MIYIVGAGPGDSGLLTLRGYEVLRRADVVIYDHLVGEGILAMIPSEAEIIDAGKYAGRHKMAQREIESAMIDRARAGKTVVRLKGGDPYIFGRGGEEAEALIRAGFSSAFEVIPGVTSAISVPECAGIPATHRDYCSGVSIFTAHDKNGNIPSLSESTSIFLMGAGNSESLQAKLIETMSPDTPCAIIENGTTPRQRTIRTALSRLHESVVRNNITPPAVIVVGHVASLNLEPRKNLPLSGKRVIITRPEGRAGKLSSLLRGIGAEVILMPTIKTSILHGSIDGVNLSGWDWAGFTSVTGVEALFSLLAETGRDIRGLGGAKIAAIGSATADALKSHGLRVDYVPEIFDGVHLAEGLSEMGGKILMFRAENGTPEIDTVFRNYGINAANVCIYRIDYVKLSRIPKFADIIIFTSSSTVRGFAASTDTLRESLAVCIGTQTADAAMSAGFERVRIAERATVEAIAEACT